MEGGKKTHRKIADERGFSRRVRCVMAVKRAHHVWATHDKRRRAPLLRPKRKRALFSKPCSISTIKVKQNQQIKPDRLIQPSRSARFRYIWVYIAFFFFALSSRWDGPHALKDTDLKPAFLLGRRMSFASGQSQPYRGVLEKEVEIWTKVYVRSQ